MTQQSPQRKTRLALKKSFEKGKLPTESSFSDLIDSVVNIMDDGLNKSEQFGYEISPIGESKTLLSFFHSLELGTSPLWQFKAKDNNGIGFEPQNKPNALYFDANGNIAIQPKYKKNPEEPSSTVVPLAVNGFVSMEGRIGTHKIGEIDGDGEYHDIITGLKDSDVYEIVARINGESGTGKYAMTQATAICTKGKSWFHKVKQNNAFCRWPWDRIKLRWKAVEPVEPNPKNKFIKVLNLQMKTRSNYGLNENGSPFKIQYHITKLWDDQFVKDMIQSQQ